MRMLVIDGCEYIAKFKWYPVSYIILKDIS